MAAPNPETGLFPGLAEPPFVDAPAVEKLALRVLDKWDEFRELRDAITIKRIRVGFVFETKPFDQLAEDFKPHTIAKVTKASPLWKSVTGYDLVIQFRRTFWEVWKGDEGDERCEAVLYHEWCHVELEVGDQGQVKLSLRHHDVEEFRDAARRYGPALPGRRALLDAFLAHQRAQGGADVVPLRAVGPDEEPSFEDFADAVGERLMDAVERGELGMPDEVTEVTVTHRGRTVSSRRGPVETQS